MKQQMKMVLAIAALASGAALAQTKEVTIGYQDMLDPYRIAQDSKEIEKATGYKINWKQFGGGGEVIKAMASGAKLLPIDFVARSEEHTSELQSRFDLVCRLLLEKKK